MINKTEYFYGIDFLRWLAAFGVVVYHYLLHFQISEIQYSSFLNYLIINKEFAPKFVWLFWTISGFVFTNIYISKNINLKNSLFRGLQDCTVAFFNPCISSNFTNLK